MKRYTVVIETVEIMAKNENEAREKLDKVRESIHFDIVEIPDGKK